MRFQKQNRGQAARAIQWLAVVGAIYFWWSCLPPAPDPWILNLARNPDKFFLWGTTNHFDYSFTYDPHAADEWRVEYGTLPVTTLPAANSQK